MFVYLEQLAPSLSFFLKSEYNSHVLRAFAWKIWLRFFLNKCLFWGIYLFVLLIYFSLTSIENQQYLNFKKEVEKILARFCKHLRRTYRTPNHTFFFKLRGLIAQVMVLPWGEFHPRVDFAPVSGQTYLSYTCSTDM